MATTYQDVEVLRDTQYSLLTIAKNTNTTERQLLESNSTVLQATIAGIVFLCGALSLAFILVGCIYIFRNRQYCYKSELKDDIRTCSPRSELTFNSDRESKTNQNSETSPKLHLPIDFDREYAPAVRFCNESPSIISFLDSAERAYDSIAAGLHGQDIDKNRIKGKRINVDIAGMSIDSSSLWQQDTTASRLGGGQYVTPHFTNASHNLKQTMPNASKLYPEDEI